MTKLCPRCKLPTLYDEEVMNCLSHDGKTYICQMCGKIESLRRISPSSAYGLKLSQRQAQAAMYGLDKDRNPNLPKVNE